MIFFYQGYNDLRNREGKVSMPQHPNYKVNTESIQVSIIETKNIKCSNNIKHEKIKIIHKYTRTIKKNITMSTITYDTKR